MSPGTECWPVPIELVAHAVINSVHTGPDQLLHDVCSNSGVQSS